MKIENSSSKQTNRLIGCLIATVIALVVITTASLFYSKANADNVTYPTQPEKEVVTKIVNNYYNEYNTYQTNNTDSPQTGNYDDEE